MAKARGKGPHYERETCKKLSLWVSGMTRKDVYWRSAMSGGRSTVQRRKGEHVETAGDICCLDPIGHWLTALFVLECKHYRELGVGSIFFGAQSKVGPFWEKLLGECQGRREPLLIARQNHQSDLAFTSEAGLRILRAGGRIQPHVIVPAKDMHVLFLADVLQLDYQRVRSVWEMRSIRQDME